MLQLIFLFLILLVFLVLFFFSGKLILSKTFLSTTSLTTQLFFNLLVGTIAFTSISALYFTHFKSIFSLVLVLGFILFFFTKTENKIEPQEKLSFGSFPFSSFIHLLVLLCILFFWFVHLLIKSDYGLTLPANPETILYAQFAKIIAATGVENNLGIGFTPTEFPTHLSPYHYFDLWLTAGISHLLSISELQSIHFFTYPILNFLNLIGLVALFEKLGSSKFYAPYLAFAFLFLTGFYFLPFLEKVTQYQFDFMEPVLAQYGEKLSFAFTFLMVVFYFFLDNKKITAIALLFLLPLLFPTLLFPIYLALPFFLVYLYRNKELSRIALKKLLLFQTITLITVFCCYHFYGTGSISLLASTDYKGLNLNSFKMLAAEIFYRSWDKPLRALFLYTPYLLLLLLAKPKKTNRSTLNGLSILALCIYSGAIFSSALFYKMPESYQIYSNTFVFYHLLLILLLVDIIFIEGSKIYYRIALLALLLSSCLFSFKGYSIAKENAKYSEPFLHEIEKIEFPTNEKFLVAYIKTAAECSSSLEIVTGGLSGSFLQLQKNFYGMINIGVEENLGDKRLSADMKRILLEQNFHRYLENENQNNQFDSIPTAQLKFLMKHHINYVLLSKNSLVTDLLLKNTMKIIEDRNSGEKFLILNSTFTFN